MNENDSVVIFGLGYVGCVSLACLAHSGVSTIGIDIDHDKISTVNHGKATIVEPDLDDLLKEGVDAELITATTDVSWALKNAEMAMITVGTPQLRSGHLDLSQIFEVCTSIANYLKINPKKFTIVIRSTIEPGTCEKIIKLVENISGLIYLKEFFVISNPEFLREGTAVSDYMTPACVVIGGPKSDGAHAVAQLYKNLGADIRYVSFGTAEAIKYINNSWHAIKVAFGNEIGSICKALKLNTDEVIDVFLSDKILNISPNYLKPGFAYGGACLPKDLNALSSIARKNGVNVPLINSASSSNDAHIDRSIKLCKEVFLDKKINFIGLSFKRNTDDVRESPSVTIIENLLTDGYEIKIFDKDVSDSINNGKNTKLLRSILGNLEHCLVADFQELEVFSDKYILAKKENSIVERVANLKKKTIVDLIGWSSSLNVENNYFTLV